MDPAGLDAAVTRTREAAGRLRSVPVSSVLDSLDGLVTRWLDPDDPFRVRAERELPALTGFSPEMIRHGLPLQLLPLRGEFIAELLDRELGTRNRVDRARSGGSAPLITHVLAGNIPFLAASPMLLTLAIKSAGLIKPASGDPLSATLLQESLHLYDPELAACLCVAHWQGGDGRFEEIAFGRADLVVASGSNVTLEAIQHRVRSRFIGHGHRVSFAVIDRTVLADRESAAIAAERLAYDVTLWDQQGCLSPQFCWLEAPEPMRERFAELLADALSRWATRLPPRRLSHEEMVDIQRFRQAAQWQPGFRLLESPSSTAWSISVEPRAQFLPTCLHRCIRLQPLENPDEIPALLAPYQPFLEAAGLAMSSDNESSMSRLLRRCGVHRTCRLGDMQTPGLDWQQGGRPRIAEWFLP